MLERAFDAISNWVLFVKDVLVRIRIKPRRGPWGFRYDQSVDSKRERLLLK